MLRSKFKEDKETLGLSEIQNNNGLVMQNWPLKCKISNYTPHKELRTTNPLLLEDQKPLAGGGVKSKRENWITFPKDNPFDEEQSISVSSLQIEGKQTRVRAVYPFNPSRQQTQKRPTQMFSVDNPFIDPETLFGNPFIVEPKIVAKKNAEFSSVHHQYQNVQFDPIQSDQPFGNSRILEPWNSSKFTSPKGEQWSQAEFLDHFEKDDTPTPGAKMSSWVFAGEPSISTSSKKINESRSNENSPRMIVKNGKGSTAKKSEHETIKKYQKSVLDNESHSTVPKNNLLVRPKICSLGELKSQKKCPPAKTEALAELFRGTAMLKFPRRRGSSSPHFKFFQLARSKTSLYLQWFSKRKPLKATTINIADMECVLQGKQSNVYLRHMEDELTPTSISIIYKKKLSVDIVAKSNEECTMWYKCLHELVRRAKLGMSLTNIQKVWIKGLNYFDRNRPKREQKNVIIRANSLSQRDKDVRVDKSNNSAVERLNTRVTKLMKLSKTGDLRNTYDHVNLMLSVASIQDRLEELKVETRESMNSSHSKHDIWRLTVDLESLEEKVQVLRKNKNFHLM